MAEDSSGGRSSGDSGRSERRPDTSRSDKTRRPPPARGGSKSGGSKGGRPPQRGGSKSGGSKSGGSSSGGRNYREDRRSTQGSRDARGGSQTGSRGRPAGSSNRSGGRDSAPRAQEGSDGRERERAPGPPVPPEITGRELDRSVLNALSSLPETLALRVGQHLVMVGQLMAEDPAQALAHAHAARDLAPRVAVLRETYGVAAYGAGDFAVALPELRAARRISGNDDLLPLIADCERGLGRPERALEVVASAPTRLPTETAVELLIVGAGARIDLGDADAAVLALQREELKAPVGPDWLPRLRFAYAEALRAAGRNDEAKRWYGLAEQADVDGALEWPGEEPEQEESGGAPAP